MEWINKVSLILLKKYKFNKIKNDYYIMYVYIKN